MAVGYQGFDTKLDISRYVDFDSGAECFNL